MSTDKVTQAQVRSAVTSLMYCIATSDGERSKVHHRTIVAFIDQHPDEPAKTTLYDWSDPRIPGWVQWLCRESQGRICGFKNKPVYYDFGDSWWSNGVWYEFILSDGHYSWGNIKNSLEQRPQP